MPSRRSAPHRPFLRTVIGIVLAATLATGVTGLAIARSAPQVTAAPASATDTHTTSAKIDPALGSNVVAKLRTTGSDRSRDVVSSLAGSRSTRLGPGMGHSAPSLATPVRSVVRARGASASSGSRAPSPASYHGRNHVWIPSLGINRSVQSFSCSRSRPPDAGVYRWGCAGRNNVYLLAHAWSTFKALHDAYVGGRLRNGMQAWYADGAGRVHAFRVIWSRVTRPTTAASWAWAPQSQPSMTLQTCLGAHSEYRLMVRLVQVN